MKEREFIALFHEHFAAIVRYAERRTSDPALAEEIAMDVMVTACERLPPDHPNGVAWLYRTAANRLNDHWRQRRRQVELHDRLVSLDQEPIPGLAHLDRLALQAAVRRLPTAHGGQR
mgnify:CR=1 FL=1